MATNSSNKQNFENHWLAPTISEVPSAVWPLRSFLAGAPDPTPSAHLFSLAWITYTFELTFKNQCVSHKVQIPGFLESMTIWPHGFFRGSIPRTCVTPSTGDPACPILLLKWLACPLQAVSWHPSALQGYSLQYCKTVVGLAWGQSKECRQKRGWTLP